MRPAFREIAESFKGIMRKQFATEGSYGSGGWAPLSPTYEEWKSLNFPGKKILEATGLLKDSLTGENDYFVEEMTKDSLLLGTQIDYAKYHQRGTDWMPKRALIQLTEADKTGWIKILQKFAVKEAKKAGLL